MGETLRAALNSLAVVAPTWVQALAPPEWYDRYAHRVENYQLPKTDAARQALAAVIGADGQVLLHAIDAERTTLVAGGASRANPPTRMGRTIHRR